MALGEALEVLGHQVYFLDRKTPLRGSELVIQTGFNKTPPLMDAIERGIPYIVMEMPHFRDLYEADMSASWGYNGLAGGAWHPTPPQEERLKPILHPMKSEGGTLVIGQKPTDHSLRGSDHVRWILQTLRELPTADFRPHPLMVLRDTLRPLREVLRDYQRVVSFTSTASVEAMVSGCEVRTDNRCNLCFGVTNRDEWLHNLSWTQGLLREFGDIGRYILSGYDEARDRIQRGLCEIPRDKVNGPEVCRRYYEALGPVRALASPSYKRTTDT